jgi:hypothetical protein
LDHTNWTLVEALEQNLRLDTLLETTRTQETHQQARERQERWRGVRRPAAALLSFAYRDLVGEGVQGAVEELAGVFEYRGNRSPFFRLYKRPRISTIEMTMIQSDVRNALARLFLRYPIWMEQEGTRRLERQDGLWLVGPGELKVAYWRPGEGAGLGLRFMVEITPAHLQVVLLAMFVLTDASSWLRFCEVCGRIFFKVKRQLGCSRRCSIVLQGRRRVSEESERSSRGRKRQAFEAAIESIHIEWIKNAQAALFCKPRRTSAGRSSRTHKNARRARLVKNPAKRRRR